MEIRAVDPFRPKRTIEKWCHECGKTVRRSQSKFSDPQTKMPYKATFCGFVCMGLHYTKFPNKVEHMRELWREKKRRLRKDPKRRKAYMEKQREYQNKWVKKKMKDPSWRDRKRKHRRNWYKRKKQKENENTRTSTQ